MSFATALDPLEAPSFDELNSLRLYLEAMLASAVPSLEVYCDEASGGFVHILKDDHLDGEFSMASTATCAEFLVNAGLWKMPDAPWAAGAQGLTDEIIASNWESADLDPGNPFTVSFLLEALADFRSQGATFSKDQRAVVQQRLSALAQQVSPGEGVSVGKFPPTAFMTYKAVRVLKRWRRLTAKSADKTAAWAWARLTEESVLVSAGGTDSDLFELAYAALTLSLCTEFWDMQPRQRDGLGHTINQFFDGQDDRGLWPRSRPLFLYPEYGNAYCYDYELLSDLLFDLQLRPLLYRRLDKLSSSAYGLDATKIPLKVGELQSATAEPTTIGWSSGHLKQQVTKPESWTTASAFQYCHRLHRLVVEAIRRTTFAYTNASYTVPSTADDVVVIDGSRFLDSQIHRGEISDDLSLTEVLTEDLLEPLSKARTAVRNGQPLPDDVNHSAILFGPPGTSKTELASLIANYLGWPLLKLDPSHLTREGLDNLHAEANRIFTMLEACEEMVVLFDEFDELVRERDEQGSESASRFLTTAMLPKLAALSSRRRIVYLLATNHLERFDSAISRPGRFDMILPVMPPTLDAKLQHWPDVADKLKELKVGTAKNRDKTLREHLSEFTFLEFKELVPKICHSRSPDQLAAAVDDAWQHCTMRAPRGDGETHPTWHDRIEADAPTIRIPGR